MRFPLEPVSVVSTESVTAKLRLLLHVGYNWYLGCSELSEDGVNEPAPELLNLLLNLNAERTLVDPCRRALMVSMSDV